MCANWTRCSGRQRRSRRRRAAARAGAGHRHRQRQRRAVDAAVAPQVEQPGGQRRTGRAAGDERMRAALGDRPGGLDDRRLGRRAHGERRIGGLGDRDRRVDDLDAIGRTRRSRPRVRTGARAMPPAAARCAPAATSRGPRSAPPASTATVIIVAGIRSTCSQRPGDNLAALVAAAHRAHAMWQPGAVALRAGVVARRADLVLRSTLRGPGVGLLLLGDGHRGGRLAGPPVAARSGARGR